VTAALINSNLRQASLIHCITVGRCKGIIFDYSLREAVADVNEDLISFNENFSFFHMGGPDPLSPEQPSLSTSSQSLDLAAEKSSDSPVPRAVRDGVECLDSLCFIYTSGTTGLPKAAYNDHSRFYMGSNMATFGCGVTTEDRIYTTMPMYHSSAMWLGVGASISVGCSVILRKKFSARHFWSDCVKYKATTAQYIGEICRFLLQSPPSPAEKEHNIRMMYGVGLRPEIWREFVTRFNIPTIREFYGSTEGTYGTINIRNKEGACGFLPRLINYNPFALIRVDKETGAVLRGSNGLCITCEPGEVGEMVGLVRVGDRGGPGKFKAYVDSEDPNKGKLIRDVWKKGDYCFRSGDYLSMDEHGWLYFQDRTGDTFRWRGENVSTLEVEAAITKVLGHTSAVVYGVEVPGAEGKAGMAAILQEEEGDKVDLDLLASGLRKALPSYARPMFVRLIRQLHLTGTYKLQKTELQKEGFDVNTIADPVFFMGPKDTTYRQLDPESYHSLLSNLAFAKL